MTEQWGDLEESEKAFPSEWIKQCEIAEAEAIDGDPVWTHEHRLDTCSFSLWVGVFAEADIPNVVEIAITHRRTLVCSTDFSNGGCILTEKDGKEVTGYDVVAIVVCREVRELLGQKRRK